MTANTIQTLTSDFESFIHETDLGIEFWLARDLQHLLGYSKVGKTIEMPKGATKEVDDLMLTRFACYLVAQNGDSKEDVKK